MNLYDRYLLPHVLHIACGLKPFRMQRSKVVPAARGRILEVGAGSGLNFSFYDPSAVELLFALEPDPGMQAKARRAARGLPFEIEMLGLRGEEIPLEDNSVDTVVITYTMCTIPGVDQALQQMRRVLKPGGKMLFTEHGRAPDAAVRKWQDRLNPAWKRLAGGCHLNREIPALIENAGFRFDHLEQDYLPGWKPVTFNYWGVASSR